MDGVLAPKTTENDRNLFDWTDDNSFSFHHDETDGRLNGNTKKHTPIHTFISNPC